MAIPHLRSWADLNRCPATQQNDFTTTLWRWWAQGYNMTQAKAVFVASSAAGTLLGSAFVLALLLHY